jgi:hypothetical protein
VESETQNFRLLKGGKTMVATMRGSTPQEMDEYLPQAVEALTQLPEESVREVAGWLKAHYMKAGYKRLCRALLPYAPKGG